MLQPMPPWLFARSRTATHLGYALIAAPISATLRKAAYRELSGAEGRRLALMRVRSRIGQKRRENVPVEQLPRPR